MGAVAVLGGIWEIVFCGPAELARSPARVSREMPGSTAGTGGLPHRRIETRFQAGLARWPYKHEMIIRREHMSEPWPRTSLEDNDSQE